MDVRVIGKGGEGQVGGGSYVRGCDRYFGVNLRIVTSCCFLWFLRYRKPRARG